MSPAMAFQQELVPYRQGYTVWSVFLLYLVSHRKGGRLPSIRQRKCGHSSTYLQRIDECLKDKSRKRLVRMDHNGFSRLFIRTHHDLLRCIRHVGNKSAQEFCRTNVLGGTAAHNRANSACQHTFAQAQAELINSQFFTFKVFSRSSSLPSAAASMHISRTSRAFGMYSAGTLISSTFPFSIPRRSSCTHQ